MARDDARVLVLAAVTLGLSFSKSGNRAGATPPGCHMLISSVAKDLGEAAAHLHARGSRRRLFLTPSPW